MARPRPRTTTALVLALLAAVLAATAALAEVSDTLSIIKDGEQGVAGAEIAARLSEATFTTAERVLIGRDDEFADALTSGLLQADSPLLLVPSAGPVPDRVLAQLLDLQASEVLLLGGPAAIAESVAEQLDAAGYAVDRAFGPSRFETATEIADLGAPDTDTVLIARAFGADPDDPTQAFADALAAGGWAAENGWPILLTQTEVLTPTTRAWLAARQVDTAYVLGGTAAVSDAVVAELAGLAGSVERVAGGDRFGTAVEVAKARGADSAADVARVTLVDGQGFDAWTGGFSAAAHSAAFDAPIVLASGDLLPDATADWLAGPVDGGGGAAFAVQGDDPGSFPVLTCVTEAVACELGRQALGLPPAPLISADPDGGEVQPGQPVQVRTDPATPLLLDGSCLADGGQIEATGGTTTVRIEGDGAGATVSQDCDLVATATLANGATTTRTFAFTVLPTPQVVFEAGPGSADTGFWQVGLDGSNPRQIVACETCSDLRLSPDRQLAVHLDDGAVVLRSGDVLGRTVEIAPARTDPTESFADPQLTPDGSAVVVSLVDTDGVDQVVRYDIGGGATTLVEGAVLAGPDAVGSQPDGGGDAALVYAPAQIGFAQSGRELRVIDAGAPGTPVPLASIGDPGAAALSPDGQRWAASDGQAGVLVVGSTEPNGGTVIESAEAADVPFPVWAGAVVLGVDGRFGDGAPRAVSVDPGTGAVTTLLTDADLTTASRPGPLAGGGALLGEVLLGLGTTIVTDDLDLVATTASPPLDPQLR